MYHNAWKSLLETRQRLLWGGDLEAGAKDGERGCDFPGGVFCVSTQGDTLKIALFLDFPTPLSGTQII